MGLTRWLGRVAARRTHALVIEVPGSWATRVAVERAVLHRGWVLASSPADADVVIVCGTPAPELREVVDSIFDQMPGPRWRCRVTVPEEVDEALDVSARELANVATQRADDATRTGYAADGDHEDHGDKDHGDMDMSPAGIPLAGGAEDRDGLEMDVVTVHLGPVLPHWPPGLVVSCHLHGDVVAAAEARMVEAAPDHADRQPGHLPPGASSREWAARRCDRAVDVLALAGWDDATSRARHARDVLLGEDVLDSGGRLLEDLLWSARRSRMLRWSLRGIRPLSLEEVTEAGLPSHLAGDVMDRLVSMLTRALSVLGEAEPPVGDVGTGVSPDVVALLITGLDLATARLVVASLDVDLLGSRRPTPHEEVAHA
jgi:hypothetical protein